MLNVVCVLRSMANSQYSDTWVRKLQNGVKQYITGDYRFTCLTDHDIRGVDTLLLRNQQWPGKGWWSKLEVFRPGLFRGPTVYLDLDMLVTGDVSKLISSDGTLTAPHNYLGARDFCSTAMAFNPEYYSFLYTDFMRTPAAYTQKFDRFGPLGIGDQGYMAFALRKRSQGWNYFERHLVPSYKENCRQGYPEMADSVAVAFHGQPKMDALDDWAGAKWKALPDV